MHVHPKHQGSRSESRETRDPGILCGRKRRGPWSPPSVLPSGATGNAGPKCSPARLSGRARACGEWIRDGSRGNAGVPGSRGLRGARQTPRRSDSRQIAASGQVRGRVPGPRRTARRPRCKSLHGSSGVAKKVDLRISYHKTKISVGG